LSGVVFFDIGQTSATIEITPTDDTDDEVLETILLSLSPRPVYSIGSHNSATVSIVDNDPLSIVVNEGGTAVITRDWLLFEDESQSPEDITYHVVAGLVHGQLELASAPGVAVNRFTQADVDAGEVLYVHDGSYTLNESFQFVIEDTLGNESEIATLRVLVQRANSWQHPTNRYNVFDDNYVDTFDLAHLVNDLFVNKSRQLLPLAPGVKPASYVNINGDDYVDTLDLAQLVHYLATTDSDRTVDIEAPQLSNNDSGIVAVGGSLLLAVDLLQYTDLQPLEEIRYTITVAPSLGRIESILAPDVAITTFTQADINARRIRYLHSGTAVDVDSFLFNVDDGRGNLLSNQQFQIEVVAEPPL
jgi:hypothetical protein